MTLKNQIDSLFVHLISHIFIHLFLVHWSLLSATPILYAASVLPMDEVISWAHDVGAKVLVDACQSVPHMVVDVKNLDTDFLVGSSHKVRTMPCTI